MFNVSRDNSYIMQVDPNDKNKKARYLRDETFITNGGDITINN